MFYIERSTAVHFFFLLFFNMSSTELDLLTLLPTEDRNYILSLLSHTDILRVSACNHSLRCTIRNDKLLWQALYKHEFLSGVYCKEEWDFVFWCIRTNPNTTSIPAKRSDVIKNVDWYDVYRRRVITEYNWRHGYSNTTEIDINWYNSYGETVNIIRVRTSATGIFFMHIYMNNRSRKYWYSVECTAYPDLKQLGNKTEKPTFSALRKRALLENNDTTEQQQQYHLPVIHHMGDHYIVGTLQYIQSNESQAMTISYRGSDEKNAYVTVDIPQHTEIRLLDGKWALLSDGYPKRVGDSFANIEIVDLENVIKHSGFINDVWEVACFYETTDKSALVKKDDASCIEWALHQFSSASPYKQLRNGWFYLPEIRSDDPIEVCVLHPSRVMIAFYEYVEETYDCCSNIGTDSYTGHRIAMADGCLPVPLLKAGLKSHLGSDSMIYCDESFNDDQMMHFPGMTNYKHVIRNLYSISVDKSGKQIMYLVDIDKKTVVRTLGKLASPFQQIYYLITGKVTNSLSERPRLLEIEDYGAL
ncbi:hypothetical protein BDF22DRAFT_673455 [Syncephalis plumigaleata]|nr:hypothetical protein BDF22DRAFT_673455 [Syncephalis plumigaleata]